MKLNDSHIDCYVTDLLYIIQHIYKEMGLLKTALKSEKEPSVSLEFIVEQMCLKQVSYLLVT